MKLIAGRIFPDYHSPQKITMPVIEVRDFSLSEPELSDIVKQIYNGALDGEAQ
jgi:hypothetical protein